MKLASRIILAAIILAVFAVFATARIYPALSGLSTISVRGISMQPTIPLSALAFVEAQDRYAVGDIVSFHTGSTITTHRISGDWSGTGKGPWQTKGDGNKAPDADLVPTASIIGKVVGYVPWLGFGLTSLQEPPVVMFLMILAATLLYLPSVRR